MDAASSPPGELALPLAAAEPSPAAAREELSPRMISEAVLDELWVTANAGSCDLTAAEFGEILSAIGTRLHFGLPAETEVTPARQVTFLRGLLLPEVALAHACALGRDVAWQRFLQTYRAPVTQAAIAITGSATLGHDLADSLYADLYGLKQDGGVRKSPLASYSGRGSLLGWLRTTLAQRHVDHHRRTYRETALDALDVAAPPAESSPAVADTSQIATAVAQTLRALDEEDRYLLVSYFLDRLTLLQIGRILRVHEATISRRLKRLVSEVRKQLLQNLQAGGLSRRAAEEALGTDPRDLEINLRALLQTSQSRAFHVQQAAQETASSGQP